MSINALMWAKGRKLDGPGAKLVLLLLADRASDDNDTCWPSVALLAAEACMHERQVRRHIGELEVAGLIAVEQRPDDRRRNLYRLRISGSCMAAMIPDHMSATSKPASTKSTVCDEIPDDMSGISGDGEYRTMDPVVPDNTPGSSGHSARVSGTQTNPKEPSLSARGAGEREPGRGSDQDHADQTFADLSERYGVTGDMQIGRAREFWARLTRSERRTALAAVGEYLDSRKASGRTMPIDIANWVMGKRWQDVADARKLRKPADAGETAHGFLASEGSPEWLAWLVFNRCCGRSSIPEYLIEKQGNTRMLRTRQRWPVAGRGMDPNVAGWVLVDKGSPQFSAWTARLREGGATAISTQSVMRDGIPVQALRVPQPFPPSKKLNDDPAAAIAADAQAGSGAI